MRDTAKLMYLLDANFYLALRSALGLDDSSGFQMATGARGILSQIDVNQIAGGIPGDALNRNFRTNPVDTLAGNYTQLFDALHEGQDYVGHALGQYYTAWLEWRSKQQSPKPPVTPQQTLEYEQNLMRQWGTEERIPTGKVNDGVSALAKGACSPMYLAGKLLTEAKGRFGYRPEQRDLNMASAPIKTCKVYAANTEFNMHGTWAKGKLSSAYDFFSLEADSAYQDLSAKLFEGGLTIDVSFRLLTVSAAPLRTGEQIFISSNDTYGPWYMDGLVAYGLKGKDDANVWVDTAKWDTFFGEKGCLRRVTSELYIVDTYKVSMTATHWFTEDEVKRMETRADVGYWPFFQSKSEGYTNSVAYSRESHRVTLTSETPANRLILLGVNTILVNDELSPRDAEI